VNVVVVVFPVASALEVEVRIRDELVLCSTAVRCGSMDMISCGYLDKGIRYAMLLDPRPDSVFLRHTLDALDVVTI
jgi:hypothetical protein